MVLISASLFGGFKSSVTEESLVDIAIWTYETFGSRQAEAYEAVLIERCEAIAAGQAISQDCAILLEGDAGEELLLARAGEHFVVFLEDPERVTIVDFLHSRSNLPKRIAALQATRHG